MSLREERAGTWHAIDVGVGTGGDGAEVRRIFHTLWLDHDVSPTNAGYVYVLLPGAGEEGTARHAAQL
jgi:hyaluronate lyase